MNPSPAPEVYVFGDCRVDAGAFELTRGGQVVKIERRPLDLLIVLLRARGQLVTRDTLHEALWGRDVYVDVDAGLHSAVRKLRLALGDSAAAPRYVDNVAGRGYRFVGTVQVESATGGAGSEPAPEPPARPAGPAATDREATAEADAGSSAPEAPAAVGAASGALGRTRRRPVGAVAVAAAAVGVALLATLWWSRPAVPDPGGVIGVLPVRNLTGRADLDVLAEGLTEETTTTLGSMASDALHVVGRAAVARVAGAPLDEVARATGATYVVDAALRAEQDRLRVTASLVRTSDGRQVWSAAYDTAGPRLLELQRDVGLAVAQQVRLRVDAAASVAERQTHQPEAYDHYLRGLAFAARREAGANRLAAESFDRATAIDPVFGPAWSARAMVELAGLLNGDADPAVVDRVAAPAIARARGARPFLPDGQFVAAYRDWVFTRRWLDAERALVEIRRTAPGQLMSRLVLGHLWSQMGRRAEAEAEMAAARALDPLEPLAHALSSQVSFQGRDFEAALAHADRAIALTPAFWIGHMTRGQALEALGRRAEALDALVEAERLSNRNSKPVSLRAYVLAVLDRRDEARALLDGLTAASAQRYVPPYAMALVHLGLGERETALDWLERAAERRDVHVMYAAVDPKWDPVRADPRMAALLERHGLVAPWHPAAE